MTIERRMSLRYFTGYSLVLLSRLLRAGVLKALQAASLAEKFSMVVWTPRDIDRDSLVNWNSRSAVESYSRLDDWLNDTEKGLVEKYFAKAGDLLNVACGAGREALLLARRGMRVTACDWSPRMIAEAQRRAREANLSVRFEVADLYGLPYPENAFDYLFLTNIAYSYVFTRRRRICFLKQAYSILRPGGVFIVSFAHAADPLPPYGPLQRLFLKLRQFALLNRDYEPGDCFLGECVHLFQPEELRQEFEEAQFIITDWLWNRGYAVLTKQ